MLTLALDTTSEKGGVGIFRDAERLALVPNEGPANGYSISLFELVEQAMALAHLQLGGIDLFAAANGPGSFTGIRVGLAAARAWGKAFSRPVRGVSVLDAMVNKFSPPPPGPDWCFPILDARRGEFYAGCFRRTIDDRANGPGSEAACHHLVAAEQNKYEPADAGWVLKPAALGTFVEERLTGSVSATCLVRAHDQAARDLRATLPIALAWRAIDGLLVDSIAEIALRQVRAQSPPPGMNLEAGYIRRPDAEINWKD